jgi:hypothetical protein
MGKGHQMLPLVIDNEGHAIGEGEENARLRNAADDGIGDGKALPAQGIEVGRKGLHLGDMVLVLGEKGSEPVGWDMFLLEELDAILENLALLPNPETHIAIGHGGESDAKRQVVGEVL